MNYKIVGWKFKSDNYGDEDKEVCIVIKEIIEFLYGYFKRDEILV